MKYLHVVEGMNEGQDIVLCEACLDAALAKAPLRVEAGERVGECDWDSVCEECGDEQEDPVARLERRSEG